jgi:sulfate adenylyltransferase
VVFMTGLSGAGKTTIAEALAAELRAEGRPVELVDGDVLRRTETADLGYDRASRDANVLRGAELAAELATGGALVVSALMAPFEASRAAARSRIEQAGVPFLLVHVSAPLEVAEARDPKGLYRRARAGEIQHFIGLDEPYEAPLDAELVIDTSVTPVPEAVARIRAALDEVEAAAP